MSKNDDLVRRLRPCPFCGGSAATVYIRDGRRAVCHSCHAAGSPEFNGRSGQPSADDRAAEKWNRRHPDAIERGAAQGVTDEAVEAAAKHIDIYAFDYPQIEKYVNNGADPFCWEQKREVARQTARRALEAAFSISTPPAPAPDAREEARMFFLATEDGDFNGNEEPCPTCGSEERGQGGYLNCECPTPQLPAVEAEAVKEHIRRAGLNARDEIIERLAGDGSPDNDLADYLEHIVDACVNAALKAKTGEIERLRRERRWTIERDGELLRVCRGDHDKAEKCEWETFVPASRLEAAEASNKALREIVPGLDHVISWLENGCDRQAAAQELRIYQSRARALLSETGGE